MYPSASRLDFQEMTCLKRRLTLLVIPASTSFLFIISEVKQLSNKNRLKDLFSNQGLQANLQNQFRETHHQSTRALSNNQALCSSHIQFQCQYQYQYPSNQLHSPCCQTDHLFRKILATSAKVSEWGSTSLSKLLITLSTNWDAACLTFQQMTVQDMSRTPKELTSLNLPTCSMIKIIPELKQVNRLTSTSKDRL